MMYSVHENGSFYGQGVHFTASVHEIQCFCGRDAQLGIDVLSIKIDIFRSCDSISVICDTALLIFQVFELILRQLVHYLLKICHSSQSTKL